MALRRALDAVKSARGTEIIRKLKLWNYIELDDEKYSPYLPWELVSEKLAKESEEITDAFMKSISGSNNLQWATVLKYPKLKWDWQLLSQNQNITWEIIQNHKDLPWDWSYVSKNPNVTWIIIKSHLDLPWDWAKIPENINITTQIVRKNLDMPWKWDFYKNERGRIKDYFNCNFCLPWEIVKENLEDKWNWSVLTLRFPWKIIHENYNLPEWEKIIRAMRCGLCI